MGGHWAVNEGYLRSKFEGGDHHVRDTVHTAVAKVLHHPTLVERYFVLYMNRKLEIFENSSKERRVDSCYLCGFSGWDGDGLLKAGESYGLELKLEKHAEGRMFVAAFNRLDLDKWCRGYVAVLDPESAAGLEVRRERRKLRKEEKRAQEEKEEKVRLWKEQQKKMIEDEKRRLQLREEEIQNMTPLERVDGLGSLDDDTARMLEKRRQRLQRRQAPTTRRVNKAAYRQRLDDAAGGKVENMVPLQAKTVAEQKMKVRVEPPPPGQFFEMAGRAGTRRDSNPPHRHRLGSIDPSESDHSSNSGESRFSSGPISSGSISGSIPPPPPSEFDDSRSDFIPPPPLPRNSSHRESRAYSHQGSLYHERQSELSSRDVERQSSRRLSGVDRDKHSAQASLAAILGGRSKRRDSFDSVAESTSGGNPLVGTRAATAMPQDPGSSMKNALAASLSAIRRNRLNTMDESSPVESPLPRKRDRKRDSQLSAEGKALLHKAMDVEPSTKSEKKGARKGLFDDSSSDDGESDEELFGARKKQDPRGGDKQTKTRSVPKSTRTNGDPTFSQSPIVTGSGNGGHGHGFMNSSDSFDMPSPGSITSPVANFAVTSSSQTKSLEVVYKSCGLQTEGKKATASYAFAFRCGGMEQPIAGSYDAFKGMHDRLSADKTLQLPKFPSNRLMRNYNKPEHMKTRATEFVEYFRQLVQIAGLFENKRFLFEYQVSDDFIQNMRDASARPAPRPHAASPSTRTPRPTASTPARRDKASNGKLYQSAALFGAEDSDSEVDSVYSSAAPQKASPTRKRTAKPSRTDLDESEAVRPSISSSRRDRSQSRQSMRSGITSKRDLGLEESRSKEPPHSEPPAPKITGLPARPNLFGGGRGDLLAAIRQGAQLKKTDVEDDAAPAQPGPATARAVPMPPPPPPPAPMANAGSVAEAITHAMAARRIHVEYEDKSDSDSDDDWD